MLVLYSTIEVLFSFLYFSNCSCLFCVLPWSVFYVYYCSLCSVIELLFSFFVFVNFSNVQVCFVFRHVQFFVFADFINVIQVLVMYPNLRVYMIVFCLYRLCGYSLLLCTSGFSVFFNFSNVLQVHLNLWVYLFVSVFVVEVLLSFLVFVR